MRRTGFAFVLLVAAFAAASWLGWWSIPLVAGLWGVLRPRFPRPILTASLAALAGWTVWLGIDYAVAPDALARTASHAAAILRVPTALFFLLTLLFPALLAGSAAALARGLADVLAPRGRS